VGEGIQFYIDYRVYWMGWKKESTKDQHELSHTKFGGKEE